MADTVAQKALVKTPLYYGWGIVGAVIVINGGMHASAHFPLGLFFLPMVADLGVSRGALSWLPMCRTFSAYFITKTLEPGTSACTCSVSACASSI